MAGERCCRATPPTGYGGFEQGCNWRRHRARRSQSGFLRFQLALALAARPETREEGITHLRYGFDFQPLFIPLIDLALGRTYEAAGKPDSAAQRYRRFLRLWDKSDPELQGRVTQARLALEELTRERPASP
jgi:hypothetical protein